MSLNNNARTRRLDRVIVSIHESSFHDVISEDARLLELDSLLARVPSLV